MEKKHVIVGLSKHKEVHFMFEWPTESQIKEMNTKELARYSIKMFDVMQSNVSPELLLSMMLDFQKARKSEKRLRKYMKNFIGIFASECNQIMDISDAEA